MVHNIPQKRDYAHENTRNQLVYIGFFTYEIHAQAVGQVILRDHRNSCLNKVQHRPGKFIDVYRNCDLDLNFHVLIISRILIVIVLSCWNNVVIGINHWWVWVKNFALDIMLHHDMISYYNVFQDHALGLQHSDFSAHRDNTLGH